MSLSIPPPLVSPSEGFSLLNSVTLATTAVRPLIPEGSPPVIAMGSGVTLTAVLRLLGRASITAFTVCPPGDFSCYSRWCRTLPGSERLRPGDLHQWLKNLDLDSAVLLPCSDDWLEATAALPPETARRFPCSIAAPTVIETFVDKWRLAQLLEKNGVRQPRTRLLNSREEMEALPEETFQEAILKPLSSIAFSSQHGVKGFFTRTREEARRAMRRASFPIMLQEFIPGPPTAGYFVEGFIDQRGRTCALFARRRLRMYPRPLGNSTFMESVALNEVEGAVAPLKNLLQTISYRGVFSAEFKHDERDGFFKLLEINARPWWYIEVPAHAGMDICQMAYLDALGLEVGAVCEYAAGQYFGYLGTDLHAWWEERKAGGGDFWSWLKSWRGARSTPFTWSDPLPALALACQQLRDYVTSWKDLRECRRPTDNAAAVREETESTESSELELGPGRVLAAIRSPEASLQGLTSTDPQRKLMSISSVRR